jgi:KipI family sensor histidine kinase inhibitor
MTDPVIRSLGDRALLIEFGEGIDPAVNAAALALAARIRAAAIPVIVDIVPAYASVAVHYYPGACGRGAVRADAWLRERLAPLFENLDAHDGAGGREHTVPVCYGGEHGPDLAAMATHLRIDEREIIARHCAPSYRVAMIGFRPGFPYLLGLDPALSMPRLATPRTQVPAGSVGIGGAQTGIYPDVAPGGWQLIGRTPLRLFDPASATPARFGPGDNLRFVAIDAAEYAALESR